MSIGHWSEADLEAFLSRVLGTRYRRRLDRFLQGTVTAVTKVANGIYHCQIQRNGEAAADGGTYVSANPGYTPAVGDLVECVWRDEDTAYVLWRLA